MLIIYCSSEWYGFPANNGSLFYLKTVYTSAIYIDIYQVVASKQKTFLMDFPRKLTHYTHIYIYFNNLQEVIINLLWKKFKEEMLQINISVICEWRKG